MEHGRKESQPEGVNKLVIAVGNRGSIQLGPWEEQCRMCSELVPCRLKRELDLLVLITWGRKQVLSKTPRPWAVSRHLCRASCLSKQELAYKGELREHEVGLRGA